MYMLIALGNQCIASFFGGNVFLPSKLFWLQLFGENRSWAFERPNLSVIMHVVNLIALCSEV